jgi:hypothetical protein
MPTYVHAIKAFHRGGAPVIDHEAGVRQLVVEDDSASAERRHVR